MHSRGVKKTHNNIHLLDKCIIRKQSDRPNQKFKWDTTKTRGWFGDFFSSAVEQGSVLGLGEKLLGSSVPCVSLKDFTEVEPWQHPAQWHPLWSAACPAVLAALRFGSGQARGREPGLCRARCRHRFPRGVSPSPSWCSATVCSTLLLREHQNTGHLCT